METFNALHINMDQEQVEIKICEHLTEGILSPFNKKLEKKLSLFFGPIWYNSIFDRI